MPEQDISLEQLRIGDYKVTVVEPLHHTAMDVTPLCQSISWSYDIDQPVETCTIKFTRGRDLMGFLQVGFRIFINAWMPLADQGLNYGTFKNYIIWDVTNDTTDGATLTVVAHDIMIYLTSNKGSHTLGDEVASDFIKRVAGLYGIPLGEITNTRQILGRELFINRTLFDIFATTLQYTRDISFVGRTSAIPDQQGPLKFILRTLNGKLTLVEKKEQKFIWKFEGGDVSLGKAGSVIAGSNKFSLDSYKNVVKIYNRRAPDESSNTQGGATAIDLFDPVIYASSPLETPPGSGNFADADGAIKRYGLLSESVDFTPPGDTAYNQSSLIDQAQLQADDLLRRLKIVWQTGTISSFNINTLQAGDAVYIDIPQINMTGKFYIKSGQHNVSAEQSDMTLTVMFEDFLPFVYRSQHESVTDTTQLGF